MLSKSTDVFAKSIGLKTSETSAYGIYGDYFTSVYDIRAKKKIEISCFIGNTEEYGDDYLNINEGIRSIVDKYNINDYSVNPDGISVTSSAPIAVLRELLDYLIGMLNDAGIPNARYCSNCGNSFASSEKRRVMTVTAGSKEHKHLLCQNCALSLTESNQNETFTEEKPAKGAVLKGSLLALAAALVASALYVLIFTLFDITGFAATVGSYFACLIALIIGGLTYFVYKLGAKRITPAGMAIICVMTGLFTVISHILGSTFGFWAFLSEKTSYSFASFTYAFGSYLGAQFTDSANLKFIIVGGLAALCTAFIAVIILYSFDFKKSSESNAVKTSIQTIK